MAPVWADHEAGHCIVTSPSGNSTVAGSFLNLLRSSGCRKITFDVDHVNPLVSIMEVYSGVRIEGSEGIKLQYDTHYRWPEGSYKRCLVRVRPSGGSTAGVTLTNLAIKNQFGEGICIEDVSGKIVQGSRFSNLKIESKTIGINLATSNNNRIENGTITGDGSSGSYGVHMVGTGNTINGGTIENFDWAVNFEGVVAQLNNVSRTNMLKIKTEAIRLHPPTPIMYPAPKDLWQAFATATQTVLTGVVNSAVRSVEVYSFKTTSQGKDYTYKMTIDPLNKIAQDMDDDARLPWNERRFTAVVNKRDLDLTSSAVALKGFVSVGQGGLTTAFSGGSQANGLDSLYVVAGDIACADSEWFWQSFDRSSGRDRNSAYRGWEVDFDKDGIDNSCVAPSCNNSRLAEDLNRDCSVQRNESDPTDNASRYDADGDGIPDHEGTGQSVDNCIGVANHDQRDSNNNGIGDACEGDSDGDGVANALDNCPTVVNRDQYDSNGNGIGDACERRIGLAPANPADADSDGILNVGDNCPAVANPDQKDTDGDGVGDVCDPDIDNDGLANTEEDLNGNGIVDTDPANPSLPVETGPLEADSDGDGICDGPGWGGGDAGTCIRPLDNCPLVNNREQTNRDEDTIGDACDLNPTLFGGSTDSDTPSGAIGDGPDETDNCPAIYNPSQTDTDSDGVGNACDPDDDNDGLDDATESGRPRAVTRTTGVPFYLRTDSDGDGYLDGVDICPIYPNKTENDNYYASGGTTMPLSSCGNFPEDDLDNDGKKGSSDNCPFIANKDQRDTDTDGQGDACDLDDDNDSGNEIECRDYLRGFSTQAPNTIPSARNDKTCDFDESANPRLFPWDPNSDHKDGEIFQPADTMCDGPGEGFDRDGSLTKCIASDPCPETYLDCTPGTEPVAPPNPGESVDEDTDNDTIPNGSDNCPDVSNFNQLDTDGDGLGDVCDPNPSVGVVPQVQGSGCSLHVEGKWNALSLAMILFNAGLLGILRRQKKFK